MFRKGKSARIGNKISAFFLIVLAGTIHRITGGRGSINWKELKQKLNDNLKRIAKNEKDPNKEEDFDVFLDRSEEERHTLIKQMIKDKYSKENEESDFKECKLKDFLEEDFKKLPIEMQILVQQRNRMVDRDNYLRTMKSYEAFRRFTFLQRLLKK